MLNKKELTAIQDVTSLYDEYVEQRSEAFDTLKLELEQRGIETSQCVEHNAETLASTGEDGIKRALYLYRKYYAADTKCSTILNLGFNLANATGKNFPLG